MTSLKSGREDVARASSRFESIFLQALHHFAWKLSPMSSGSSVASGSVAFRLNDEIAAIQMDSRVSKRLFIRAGI